MSKGKHDDQIRELMAKGMSAAEIARKLHAPSSTVSDAVRRMGLIKPATSADDVPSLSTSSASVDVESVVARLDMVGKALAIIAGIPQGKVLPDDVLRQRLGLGNDRWRRVRGSARLSGYWYETPVPNRAMLWGSKKTIAAMGARISELL